MVSGVSLTLGGIASPRRESTLDNVFISDYLAVLSPLGSMLDVNA